MSHLGRKPIREFTVVIYEADYKELCSWVLKKPNIETGGDLFGLWANKYTAVVQLVVGPGKDCRRTSVSFYQDVDYLKCVGTYLTEKEGLCHIGEWHSHHKLGLARPSGGDENTVWSNMPSYHLQRFVIFIANISSSPDKGNVAKAGCFLFELDDRNGSQRPVLQGKFRILPEKSPLHYKRMVNSGLSSGRESSNSPEELQRLSLSKRNESEMCPTVYRSLETLKRKGKDDKKHTSSLSPNLKQMKTERGEAVSSEGYKAERDERKKLSGQGVKKDTDGLTRKLQEQKLDDNVKHVGASASLAGEKNSTISEHKDVEMIDEQITRVENAPAVQERGEDGKTVNKNQQSIEGQDEEAQENMDSEVHHEKTWSEVTKYEESPPQADLVKGREKGGEDQERSSTESGVHLQPPAKTGDEDHEKTGSEVTKDEESPPPADLVKGREKGGEDQERSSTESGVHLEPPAKTGDEDHEKTGSEVTKDEESPPEAELVKGRGKGGEDEVKESAKTRDKDHEKGSQATKDEGTPSAAGAVQTNVQSQDGKSADSRKTTKHTKEMIPGPMASGKQAERKIPGKIKPKEPTSKKAGTSMRTAPGRSGTQQPLGRKPSGTTGDKKGTNTTSKQVNPAKKGASVTSQPRGQKGQVNMSTTMSQKPKKSGPGAATVTQQGSTRQRQASRAAQEKKGTPTAKKTNQSRPEGPGKAPTSRGTRTSTRK